MKQLTLDIVGPAGRVLHVERLDSVVVRRRELGREFGSEINLLRGHAPLLMQVQPGEIRYAGPSARGSFTVPQALLEVWGSTVTVVLT
ncbi:MAG TPA: hypothetical protein VFG89_01045 [Coriobacteriia bacterium]|nr:hypothetical protein [Coriobacteriia bacterium]